ncbi:hypothetical protein RB653_002024 [Dictyostelium firmibasis]|uniref:Uncharacterized protein n=1 Tax=Dictyostelium firmibasis TaxID=79012 RepID=A0AAN7YSA1_9MYCE
MKFRDYLKDNKVSHWRDKYIDYEYLKNLIDNEYINAEILNSAIIDLPISPEEQININKENTNKDVNNTLNNGVPPTTNIGITTLQDSSGEDDEEDEDENENENENGSGSGSGGGGSGGGGGGGVVGDDDDEIEMDDLGIDDNGDIVIKATAGGRVKVKKGINKGVKRLKKIAKNTNNRLSKMVSRSPKNNKGLSSSGELEGDEMQLDGGISSQIEVIATNNMTTNTVFVPQETFQDAFIDQVNKVDTFFVDRYRKTKFKCIDLCNMIPFLSENEQLRTIRNIDYVKQGFHDNYHYLESLEAFKKLNLDGFKKVLDKYEKINPRIAKECRKYLDNTRLTSSNSPVRELSRRIKQIYARFFTGNDIKLANNQIRTNKQVNQFQNYIIGFLIGASVILISQVIFKFYYYFPHETPPINSTMAWLLFRISALPIILGTLFALMTKLWEKAGINYVFIFELKPDIKRSSSRYLMYGMMFVTMWLIVFNVYVDSISNKTEESLTSRYLLLIPLLFILGTIFVLFLPFKILAHRTRFWVLHKMSKVVQAPFVPVRFPDFFMSVQLLCLGEFLFNMQSIVCMFKFNDPTFVPSSICIKSRAVIFPILSVLPFYWRAMQCVRRFWETGQFFPHITSAIRSTFSIVTSILLWVANNYGNTEWSWIKILWFVINVIGSFYKIYADFTVDWGLFLNYKTNKQWPLREKMVFKRKWVYYMAMSFDSFFRFVWLIVFSIRQGTTYRLDHPLFLFWFSLSEIAWAAQFIFFRVESEHVQCADTYSHFKDIPLPFSQEYKNYMEEKKSRYDVQQHHHGDNNNETKDGTHRRNLVNIHNPYVDDDDDDDESIDSEADSKDLNLESNSEFVDDEGYNQRKNSIISSIRKIASSQDMNSMNRISSHPDLYSTMQRFAGHVPDQESSMPRMYSHPDFNHPIPRVLTTHVEVNPSTLRTVPQHRINNYPNQRVISHADFNQSILRVGAPRVEFNSTVQQRSPQGEIQSSMIRNHSRAADLNSSMQRIQSHPELNSSSNRYLNDPHSPMHRLITRADLNKSR